MLDIKLFDLLKGISEEYALNAARFLPEPQKTRELEKLISKFRKAGSAQMFLKAVRLLDRPPTHEEKLKVFNAGIAKGTLEGYREVCDLRVRRLTRQEIEGYFQLSCEKNDNHMILVFATKFPEPRRTEEIMRRYRELVKKKEYAQALEAISYTTRSWEVKKWRSLFEKCLKEGNIFTARKISEIQCRALSFSELEDLMKGAVKNGYLAEAEAIALELGREMSLEELRSILKVSLRLKRSDYVRMTADRIIDKFRS